MIGFSLSAEQQQIKQNSAAFASSVLASASEVYAGASTQGERFESTRSLYRTAVENGLIKAQIPVPMGGLNTGLVDAAIAFEEMYAVDASLTLTGRPTAQVGIPRAPTFNVSSAAYLKMACHKTHPLILALPSLC
jgi:alkylation response protein AidB-like acyl-CoA dehydrogenase